MSKAVYVGLSGPTYYDYQNHAGRSRNDLMSSPNPILENAFGLAVFYDELWFLCESLCPQSLRAHSKVRYVDRILESYSDPTVAGKVKQILHDGFQRSQMIQVPGDVPGDNFKSYWDGVQRAGVYWWADKGRAIDNHSHGLDVLGAQCGANSNSYVHLMTDLKVFGILQKMRDIDICLNSFGKNLYKALYASDYHPLVAASMKAQLGTYVINARVDNSVDTRGPSAEVFEKIYASGFVKDFRRYIDAKEFEDAGECYKEVVNEIDDAVRKEIQKAARNARPIRGIANILVDTAADMSGVSAAKKAGEWYLSAVNPSPIGAAAFLLDLDR